MAFDGYLSADELRGEFINKTALLSLELEPVSAVEMYRFLFPSGVLQEAGAKGDGKACGIVRWRDRREKSRKRFVRKFVFDDLSAIEEVFGTPECFMPLCSFVGKRATVENARWCHGIAIDLDYVGITQLGDFLHQARTGYYFPLPNFVVNSGTGLHVYYAFERPIALTEQSVHALNELKKNVVNLVWNKYTSMDPHKQVQGIVQGYRVPGTQTKLGKDYPVTAFKMSDERVAPSSFEPFLPFWDRDLAPLFAKLRTPIGEARELWPEWYQKRIVDGIPRSKTPGKWHIKRDLFDWWVRTMDGGARDGNRYACLKALAAYAVKCDVPEDEVRDLAEEMLPWLDSLTKTEANHFTREDMEDAMRAGFNSARSMERYPIKEVERTTGIQIPRNKRNGRKQAVHLMGARAIQEINDKVNGTNWRAGNGRKPKRDLVRNYAAEHPEANHSEIARALGVSRPTVIKWLKDGQ